MPDRREAYTLRWAAIAVIAISLAALAPGTGAFAQAESAPASVPAAPAPRTAGLISLSGRVVDGEPRSFVLRSGDADITVDMRGFAAYEDYAVLEGDHVVVSGPLDGLSLAARALRPTGLYADSNDIFYSRGGTAPEGHVMSSIDTSGDYVRLTAEVTAKTGDDIEIGLDGTTVAIPHANLPSGTVSRIEPGDLVFVHGLIDPAFWERKELEAETLVVLEEVYTNPTLED